MNYLVLSGSNHGRKTRIAMEAVHQRLLEKVSDADRLDLIDLQDLQMEFSDGRHPMDWTGDNRTLIDLIMAANVIFIGTPIFQASIPGALKNVFDLLGEGALDHKVVAMVVTAGSPRHYLVAEQQLKPILSYMKAVVVPKYVFIESREFGVGGVGGSDGAGEAGGPGGASGPDMTIVSDDIHFRLDNLVSDTLLLSQAYQELWQAQEDEFGF